MFCLITTANERVLLNTPCSLLTQTRLYYLEKTYPYSRLEKAMEKEVRGSRSSREMIQWQHFLPSSSLEMLFIASEGPILVSGSLIQLVHRVCSMYYHLNLKIGVIKNFKRVHLLNIHCLCMHPCMHACMYAYVCMHACLLLIRVSALQVSCKISKNLA